MYRNCIKTDVAKDFHTELPFQQFRFGEETVPFALSFAAEDQNSEFEPPRKKLVPKTPYLHLHLLLSMRFSTIKKNGKITAVVQKTNSKTMLSLYRLGLRIRQFEQPNIFLKDRHFCNGSRPVLVCLSTG